MVRSIPRIVHLARPRVSDSVRSPCRPLCNQRAQTGSPTSTGSKKSDRGESKTTPPVRHMSRQSVGQGNLDARDLIVVALCRVSSFGLWSALWSMRLVGIKQQAQRVAQICPVCTEAAPSKQAINLPLAFAACQKSHDQRCLAAGPHPTVRP